MTWHKATISQPPCQRQRLNNGHGPVPGGSRARCGDRRVAPGRKSRYEQAARPRGHAFIVSDRSIFLTTAVGINLDCPACVNRIRQQYLTVALPLTHHRQTYCLDRLHYVDD